MYAYKSSIFSAFHNHCIVTSSSTVCIPCSAHHHIPYVHTITLHTITFHTVHTITFHIVHTITFYIVHTITFHIVHTITALTFKPILFLFRLLLFLPVSCQSL